VDVRFQDIDEKTRYKMLTALVIPRPIAFVSTLSANGVANCAPFSFFNVLSSVPPILAINIGTREDGLAKHTLKNILRTKEFVVNLVDEATANGMHIASGEFPEEESEFDKAGFTPVPAAAVKHPRIAESPAAFECTLWKHIELPHSRAIVMGEIVHLHAREGLIDPKTWRIVDAAYEPVGRLYANGYCTTRQRFKLPGALPPK
jgi:flavin reductase (DIM6/NTAB) family NADH-FMN oxidoreductase RutF